MVRALGAPVSITSRRCVALVALLAQLLSAAAFAWYGVHCLRSGRMVEEFERYGLARFRALTGALQVAGSVGLLVGLLFRPLTVLAAGGLAALMLCGTVVRVVIRDPWYAAIPALSLLVLNSFILLAALGEIG